MGQFKGHPSQLYLPRTHLKTIYALIYNGTDQCATHKKTSVAQLAETFRQLGDITLAAPGKV